MGKFILNSLATFMLTFLLGSLIPVRPDWRVSVALIPAVALGVISLPQRYAQYVTALAMGAVVMTCGKMAETLLGLIPEPWSVSQVSWARVTLPSRPRIIRREQEAPRRRRSTIPPL